MQYRAAVADSDCAIAQALAVVGDWWTLLVVRDVAGGRHRFEEIHRELGVSRKVLTERLTGLVADGVLERRRYNERPPRDSYHLTAAGVGLLPVLAGLQDWGSRFVLGDGTVSGLPDPGCDDVQRVHALAGTTVPEVTVVNADGQRRDPIAAHGWTVLYCYPGAYATATDYPDRWAEVPGARGCTLEAATYSDRHQQLRARDATVIGISTQRPDHQTAFAHSQQLPFPLMSDQDLELTAALRLPTFRAGGAPRLKRLTVLIDDTRCIRHVFYPIEDPAGSVEDVLDALDHHTANRHA